MVRNASGALTAGFSLRHFLKRAVAFLLALCAFLSPALAHPHIFIDAHARITFDADGAVSEIHNTWVFDEAYSAWAVQGLDTDNDGTVSEAEMQPLADDNLQGLSEYGFYTFAGEGQTNLTLHALPGATYTYDGRRVTLDFGVAPEQPYRIGQTLEINITDPEYYVAISFADPSTITLENAPSGCAVRLDPPKEMDPALADTLYALPADVTKLPPDLEKAVRQLQGAILVDCPGAGTPVATPPQTAIEAANQVALVKPAPFSGPPVETSFLPVTGPFKWIADAQRAFYAMLTSALARLKSDNAAFWILGGLSFVYGIVHAAGPGHGKVVISSYMLASESRIRRGLVLSFAAAMVQAIVAVLFILIAALLLNMTSLAMSAAANWVVAASYGLVMLLGLWLIVRRFTGHGHHHPDLGARAHAHLHAGEEEHHHHEHVHHAIMPEQARGHWREQLGVVLAVGMRPCSGALVVLVFALSQGLLAAGILAVFLMALGTAMTVALLATIAVSAKSLARRLLTAEGGVAGDVVWWLELFGALIVFGFGAVLFTASFF
jgi:ABC-type nickel/cobalt efflux system permease component RcnA/ABC-type uncharacterized transport system substrate-binding protein